MESRVFYRKWRPQTLAEIAGQEQVTHTLSNALTTGHVSHAYLFCGPRGTGKTSTGRILAKAVNCLSSGKGEPCNACTMCQAITDGRALDVIEIDAASNRGIDEIRELRERVNYAPNEARYKVYIIDEVHMLTKEAANALLKTLEEPPPYIIFILATTEAHKVLPTIMSRCQRFDFRRISQSDVASKLAHICSVEGIQLELEGLRLIARAATGSLRDAENLLEQLTTYYGAEIGLQQIQATLGISGDWRVKELVKHIVNNNTSAGITTINSVNSDGLDLRQFNREVVEYLRALLLAKAGSGDIIDSTAEDRAELNELAARAPLSRILKAVKLFGQLTLSLDNYSTLPIELALVDCTLPPEEEKKTITAQVEPKARKPVKATIPPPAPVYVKQNEAGAGATSIPEPGVPVPASVPGPGGAPAPTTETVTTTTPQKGNNEIERLRLNWREVIEQAPADTKKTPAIAILRSAGVKPVSIENDIVVLAFKYPLHKESMEKVENQQVVQKIISNYLGRSCRVHCIYEPDNNHLLKAALKMGAQIIDVEEK